MPQSRSLRRTPCNGCGGLGHVMKQTMQDKWYKSPKENYKLESSTCLVCDGSGDQPETRESVLIG